MVRGRHLDLGAMEGSKAAFDDHQALVAAGGIFHQADGVIVGLKGPFTVVLGSFPGRPRGRCGYDRLW